MGVGALCAIAIATPKHLRWFWALHFPNKPENLRTDNRVETLEAAKAEFERVVRDYSRSDEAALAREQLRTTGR